MKNKPAKRESVLRHLTGTSEFEERRKAARLDIPLQVEYMIKGRRAEGFERALTKDVSAGGCLLLAKEEIPPDSVLDLKIFLGEKEEETILLKGGIVRLNSSQGGFYEYGVVFDGLSAEARRMFADFCFAKMYEMIGLANWPTAKVQGK